MSKRRATPFRSTNFYEEPLKIDKWEQLHLDPIPPAANIGAKKSDTSPAACRATGKRTNH